MSLGSVCFDARVLHLWNPTLRHGQLQSELPSGRCHRLKTTTGFKAESGDELVDKLLPECAARSRNLWNRRMKCRMGKDCLIGSYSLGEGGTKATPVFCSLLSELLKSQGIKMVKNPKLLGQLWFFLPSFLYGRSTFYEGETVCVSEGLYSEFVKFGGLCRFQVFILDAHK